MGRNEYDKKKGVDMKKEQDDIDNDIYGSYEQNRSWQADQAKYFKETGAKGLKDGGLDGDTRKRLGSRYQESSEDTGERQRKMNSVRRQRNK